MDDYSKAGATGRFRAPRDRRVNAPVQFVYASGEPVQKGDRIRYADGDGIVEFVADPAIADPDTAYYFEEFGGGCMILTERLRPRVRRGAPRRRRSGIRVAGRIAAGVTSVSGRSRAAPE